MNGDVREFQRICQAMAEASAIPDLDERELVTRFFAEGFFSVLGYGRVGEDVRLEQRTSRGRVDVILRAFGARPICVLEFKRPLTPLSPWVSQLEDYAQDLLPECALLINGNDLLLFGCEAGNLLQPPLEAMRLEALTTRQARSIYERLRRRDVDLRNLDSVLAALEQTQQYPLHVSGPQEPGGRQFIARFRLGGQTAFGRLVTELAAALATLSGPTDFARGAYEFWRRVYARELDLDEAPRAWRDLVPQGGRDGLYRFMFALETGYVLLSRVLLAKAMQDTGFPGVDSVEAYRNSLRLGQHRGGLPPQAYLDATSNLFQYAGRQAFSSLFANDIFDWWQDAMSLSDPARLADALAEATIAVFSFDFSRLQGDILGTLYQSYFDPETRLALGEFYTPPEVVDFILDTLDYQGPAITTARLLDPACGSGTFLVHALTRYLNASAGRNPATVLRGLIDGLRIVGFDINPFATLMAQVNYAAHLLPTYAEALRTQPDFELPSIPVFRTDSLRQENREGEQESIGNQLQQMAFRMETSEDIADIRTELPILVREGEVVEVLVAVPRFDRARERGLLNNAEEYFKVVQVVFRASREGQVNQQQLEHYLELALGRRIPALARFVTEAVEKNADTIEQLRHEYGDGRFLKTLEDLSLALVLKNDLRYDYVVGNPPYVRIQRIPEIFRRRWEQMYTWAEGNFDIYIPFIQRAVMQWLRDGGRLGFICSDRFLLANYGAPLREHLPNESKIDLLLDLRDSKVFKQALNYPAIIALHRGSSDQPYTFPAGRAFADPSEGGIESLLAEGKELLRHADESNSHEVGQYVDAFPQNCDLLGRAGWFLMPSHENRVFCSLEQSATHCLEELTTTQSGGFAGYQTSADDTLLLRMTEDHGNMIRLVPKGGSSVVDIELSMLRPWLFGRDVERWHVAWDRWYVLFPYWRVEGAYRILPSRAYPGRFSYEGHTPYIEDFVGAWTYLSRNEAVLRRREGNRFREGRGDEHVWYGAAYPRSIDLYEMPKIVIQMSSQWPDMAADELGYVFQAGGRGGGVYGVILDTHRIDFWLALAMLNSSPLDFYLKHISTVYGGHTYSYSDQFIKQLPLRLPQTRRERGIARRLTELAKDLTHSKDELRRLEAERDAFPSPQAHNIGTNRELYALSHIAVGGLRSQNISTRQPALSPEMDQQWRVSLGREHLTLPTEAHARVVEAWLNLKQGREVAADNLMNMIVPNTAEGCLQLLEALRLTQAEISRLEAHISDGEVEVNQLVTDLYRVDREGRRVIREFLERF
jgi:hypothetical protein